MQIIRLNDLKQTPNIKLKQAVYCLGMFDTFHLGHQQLIAQAQAIAKQQQVPLGVVTFNMSFQDWQAQHSQSFLSPAQKQALFAAAGFDYYIELEANPTIFATSKTTFVDFLATKLKVHHLVVGFDFRFGAKRQGDSAFLVNFFHDTKVTVVPCISFTKQNKISSSKIKSWLRVGQITRVNKVVAVPYQYQAIVVRGSQMGHKLGYPTANQKVINQLLIPFGVYAAKVILPNQTTYLAMACYYEKANDNLLETYLLNFDDNLYDQVITVQFYDYLRPSLIPRNWAELISWMDGDLAATKQFFKQ